MSTKTDQTTLLCVVLPNKTELNIAVRLKCKGQEVITHLSELLDINELYLFGLSLIKDNDHFFLDLEKKLSTYFPKAWKQNILPKRLVLHLKVQYYIKNGRLIVDKKARSLYCTELRDRVLCSQCYGQEGQYFQLAAYALQADLGDWREGENPYFNPQGYFPPWILIKRGWDYVVKYTPALHKELIGMSACDASLLFIEEACSLIDVPVTFYSLTKGKKEQRANVLLGLALTGLQIYEVEPASGKQQLLYEFVWSSIDRLTVQGRRFKIRADGLAGSHLVLYTRSVLQSQHLLKHISNSHRVHLNTEHSLKQLQRTGGRTQREKYIRDSTDPVTEDSEDELPPMKLYVDKFRKHCADLITEERTWGTSKRAQWKQGSGLDELEMCVDEPEEMFVDDPEELLHLTELLEGVSVDGPPLMTVPNWIDFTKEMKQVIKWRASRLSLRCCRESTEKLHLSHSPSPEQHVQEDTI